MRPFAVLALLAPALLGLSGDGEARARFGWRRGPVRMSLAHLSVAMTHAGRQPDSPAAAPGRWGSSLDAMISAAAARHGVPVRLAHAIIRLESNYACAARNRSGAAGLMQVLPRTARGVGVAGPLADCATGLEAGMRYLRQAVARGGAGCVGASLYNAGTGAPRACTAYGRRAMALAGGAP